jgi:hypothetical protein
MDVIGTVVSFEDGVQVPKNGGGFYPGARFAYRDDTGALKEKGFHQNVFKFNSGLKTQLLNLKAGEQFVMNMEKEGEFWNVKSVLPAEKATMVQSATPTVDGKTNPYVSPKSNYETPEERAKKQVYIVRQSSITAALTFATGKKISTVKEILDIAKQFEAHVFGEEFDDGSIATMSNDIEGIIQ